MGPRQECNLNHRHRPPAHGKLGRLPHAARPRVADQRQIAKTEQQIETGLLARLQDLKYTVRPDITDRAALEANFRERFEALNRVRLSNGELRGYSMR